MKPQFFTSADGSTRCRRCRLHPDQCSCRSMKQPYNVGTSQTSVEGLRLPNTRDPSPLDAVLDKAVGTKVTGWAVSPKGRRGLLLSDDRSDYVLWTGERGDRQWFNLVPVEE